MEIVEKEKMSAGDDNGTGMSIGCSASTHGSVADTDMPMPSSSHHVTGHGGFDEITEIMEEAEANKNDNMETLSDPHNHPNRDHDHFVYVAVGNGETSMDALSWTITHFPTTLVYLVHIFSHPKFFPSPLGGGRVPKSQVSPELAETYMDQERRRRGELLNKYINQCIGHLVKVETILIESDSVTDAITELISVLNIPKLVIGISNSNLRKLGDGKGKGKGSGIVAEQILQRAPPECEVNIICQGNDVSHQLISSPITSMPELMSPVPNLDSSTKEGSKDTSMHQHSSPSISFSCCFKPKG